MRRLVLSVMMASGLVMIGAGSASAEPAPVAQAKAEPGKKMCKIESPLLDELSGLVATKNGYVVINDGTERESHKRVFYLNTDCGIDEQVRYSGDGPLDPEDMVLSADGETLWIADIGDNRKVRKTVALWKMPADGSKRPTLFRLSYPSGDGPYDSEALLLDGDGTPIIVTKALTKALVYAPTGPLKANSPDGVPMKRVGEISVPPSTTPTPVLSFARGLISGGAVAPGGGRVVLRTYTDALEWDVKGGDVVAALKGTPRVTPLPDELQGEAIAYTDDGKSFLTVTDMSGKVDEDNPNYILRYTPATKVSTLSTGKAGSSAAAKADGPSWFSQLSLDDITYLVGGVGVLGAILVGLGIFGIVRSRRKTPLEPLAAAGNGKVLPDDRDAATAMMPPVRDTPGPSRGRPSGAAQTPAPHTPAPHTPAGSVPHVPGPAGQGAGGSGQRPGVYGGARPSGAAKPTPPGVYGAQPSPAPPAAAPPAPKKGGVYGGAPAPGGRSGTGVYGAPPPAAPPPPPAPAPPSRPQGQQSGRPQGRPGHPQAQPGRVPGPPPQVPPGPPPAHPGYGRDPRDR